MRIYFLIIIITLVNFSSFSQKRQAKREIEKKGVIYNNEISFGARLYSNGWGLFGERSKIINIYKTRVIQFGFASIRNYKEKKQSPQITHIDANCSFQESPKDFFYGKQNSFFVLRAGYGFRKTIAEKAEKNGVRLSLLYLGGISLGWLKPYYLELAYPRENPNPSCPSQTFEVVSQKYREGSVETGGNEDVFLDWYAIDGASGFGVGLREIEPVPGVYGKLGLCFDWAGREEFVKSLEAGIILDAYYKKIEIMISDDNKPYFIAAYISFQFGKRW